MRKESADCALAACTNVQTEMVKERSTVRARQYYRDAVRARARAFVRSARVRWSCEIGAFCNPSQMPNSHFNFKVNYCNVEKVSQSHSTTQRGILGRKSGGERGSGNLDPTRVPTKISIYLTSENREGKAALLHGAFGLYLGHVYQGYHVRKKQNFCKLMPKILYRVVQKSVGFVA